ncbi:hypothetical protein IG193_07755 [Infirmifilum lucidum]|uniref:Uncharacterized protein n=1 Tax=Infirmifilum lucidum TaxID=2776706 RepID=A0A7L9FH41_9CREN|nr:hypothetical protein [Infirmifilum lucidum]QOJ78642.1 hypothetical protein IG193_07755 [Infirmifilum lucidum]
MNRGRGLQELVALGSLVAIVLIVFAPAIALYIAPTTTTPHTGTGSQEAKTPAYRLPEGFNVYVLATEDKVEMFRKVFGRLGVPARVSTTLEPAHATQATALLVDTGWARRHGATLRDTVREALASGKPIAVIGRDAGNAFTGTIGRDSIASQFTLWVASAGGPDRITSFRLKPEVTIFAVHAERDKTGYIPCYFVLEGMYPLERLVAEWLDWITEVVGRRAGSTHSITNITGFTLIGWVDWKTSSIEYYGMKAGRIHVRSKYYYYSSQGASGKLYRYFLVRVAHLTTVYSSGPIHWTFSKAVTEVDGMTDIFPGQILLGYEPGINTSCTKFTVSVKPTRAGVSTSASYDPNAVSYTTLKYSSKGIVRWTHAPCQHVPNVTWWVEPSAVFYLDPDRPGGVEPLIVGHYFYSEAKGRAPPSLYVELDAGSTIAYVVYVWSNGTIWERPQWRS